MNPIKNVDDKIIHSKRHLIDDKFVNENMEAKRIKA